MSILATLVTLLITVSALANDYRSTADIISTERNINNDRNTTEIMKAGIQRNRTNSGIQEEVPINQNQSAQTRKPLGTVDVEIKFPDGELKKYEFSQDSLGDRYATLPLKIKGMTCKIGFIKAVDQTPVVEIGCWTVTGPDLLFKTSAVALCSVPHWSGMLVGQSSLKKKQRDYKEHEITFMCY